MPKWNPARFDKFEPGGRGRRSSAVQLYFLIDIAKMRGLERETQP
jgi:hypothetical protein